MDYTAWIDAVRFLHTTPDGPDARRVLATMNTRQLFRVALFSKKMYAIVASYLDHLKDFGVDEDPDDLMDMSDDESSDAGSTDAQPTDDIAAMAGEQRSLFRCT
jgi:hypothetical protein